MSSFVIPAWDLAHILGISFHPYCQPCYDACVDDFHIHIATANGFLELDMLDEAADALEEIQPHLRMRAEVLDVRAEIYCRLSRWEEMAAVGKLLAELYPEEATHHLTYAFAVRLADSLEAACEILNAVAHQFPDEAHFQYTLGSYESLLGLFERAFYHIRRALELDPPRASMALRDPDIEPLWDALQEVSDDAE